MSTYQLYTPSQDDCPLHIFLGVLIRLRQELERLWHHQPAVQLTVGDIILNTLQKERKWLTNLEQDT